MNGFNRYRLTAGIIAIFAVDALPALAITDSVTIQDIRIGRDGSRSRVVLDLSGSTDFTFSHEPCAPRVTVQLPGVVGAVALSPAQWGKTPISNITSVDLDGGAHLVTIDLASDTVDVVHFTLEPFGMPDTAAFRIVIDLRSSQPEDAEAAASDCNANDLPASAGSSGTQLVTAEPEVSPDTVEESIKKSHEVEGPSRAFLDDWYFGGLWQHEIAFDRNGDQKFESLVEPLITGRLGSAIDVTATFRLRADLSGKLGPAAARPENYASINGPLYNSANSEFSVRELYIEFDTDHSYWKLGKQQVVWGQADGIKLLDVVNPQSFREFILDDFDDSRIPLWTASVETALTGAHNLQILWIPDTTYHELAEPETPYAFSSPKFVPTLQPGVSVILNDVKKPDDIVKDSELGLRYSLMAGGWDVSANYLYHYHDFPVYFTELEGDGTVSVDPRYERNHLLGATLSTSAGHFTFRGELAYNTDTFHVSQDAVSQNVWRSAELASVFGVDWLLNSDNLLSAQWYYSRLLDHNNEVVRDQSEQIMTLLWRPTFGNNSWELSTLGMYSLNDHDSLIQLKLRYWWLSNLQVWWGADIFSGDSAGAFGQFSNEDRWLVGFEMGF